jgi:hypothetical protein
MPKQTLKNKKTGKILRIKQGYNPNSSSLGSVVFSFPTAMVALPVIFATVGALLMTKFINQNNVSSDKDEATDKEQSSPEPSKQENNEK